MNNILKLLAPIKKHKGRYLVYILISIFYGIIWPIQSVIVSKIIANVEHKNIQGLQNYAIAFLVIILIIYGTMYSMRNFRRNTKRIFQEEVYHKYLHKYLTADNNQIEILGTGQANSIFQRGCESRNNFINGIIIESGTRILTLFTAIIAIVWIYLGWQTLLICLVVFFIIFGISLRGTIRMKTIRKGRRESFIQMDRSIIKVIMSKFEILQNGKSAKEVNTIGKYVKELKQRDMKESVGYIYGSDIGKFIIDITKRGFIVRYGIRIFNGQSNFSEFTLIWMMLNQLSGVLFEASDIIINSSDQITYIQKLQDTFENIPKIKGYEEGKDFAFKQGDIRINNVHFSYGDKQVLNQFSLDITGGYKTAFVGQSGTGKTTLLKLLAGYVHPNTGSIEVDGQNLQDIALKSYYTNIGYLTQDPNVFDGTVIENLLYGTKTKPTKKKIKDAIEGAQCHFIYEFKDQLETQIGEKGVRLSGGQKQRLAIAKLFLKNPHIILLDEPTSALDSFSEEEITKALNNLFIGRTVIVAAHRLQTVKKADQIIVLGDHGNIIEKGNHQELVEKKGTYYNMIELQSGF